MKTKKRYVWPSDYMADPSVHVFDGKLYIAFFYVAEILRRKAPDYHPSFMRTGSIM